MFDSAAQSVLLREELAITLRNIFELRGYLSIETPLLERAEMYMLKAGGTISSRLYSFEEPSGILVALRPEITSSIIRYAVQNFEDFNVPKRFQYCGAVFRYSTKEEKYGDKPRQFTQIGAELLGTTDSAGDAEIIAMANEGLDKLGFKSAVISIGHVGLINQLVAQFNVPKRVKLFLNSNIGLLANGTMSVAEVFKKAQSYGLVTNSTKHRYDEKQASQLLDSFVSPTNSNSGLRTREEIIQRMAHKRLDSIERNKMHKVIKFISEIVKVKGSHNYALKKGKEIANAHRLDTRHFEQLGKIIDDTIREGVPQERIQVDLGISREFSYYTGIIFNVFLDSTDTLTIGGGGRYDELANWFYKKTHLPAVGFFYHLEALAERTTNKPQSNTSTVLINVGNTTESKAQALKRAASLRESGRRAVVCFKDSDNSELDNLKRMYSNATVERF